MTNRYLSDPMGWQHKAVQTRGVLESVKVPIALCVWKSNPAREEESG